MGWFLKNGKNKKKKRGGKRASQAPAWDPQRTLLGLKVLGGVALVVIAVLGWTSTERILGGYASEKRSTPVVPETVQLDDAPQWMDATMREHLTRAVALEVGADPLDRRGLASAVQRLASEPWVAQVHQVRRAPNGTVHVVAEYRRPSAIVERVRERDAEEPGPRYEVLGYYIVDREGVWLEGPFKTYAAASARPLPVVTAITADPPGLGKPFPGTDIPSALSLDRLLQRELYYDQITAFDITRRDTKGRPWLILRTDGPAVVWGLPPGQERSVEPEAPIKLGALRDWAYSHGGRINTGANVVWVYTGVAQIDARPATGQASRR